ncbi:PTS system mannose/fructose/sorbose family transporter subunit IID [Oceanivirga salmonicida]|uniref:PTS system mannose/fructose/sorbose family transporter subunit IID n=1 Tax=Oceanivirga salmonicida TaxID=1769291 RepID=UPI000830EEE7|nr:PTS system mannose/fructose/sorbose family transporter subunit IID [Oceanivirga salmonicida]
MEKKLKLSKKDRLAVAFRHQFLQGSWNYERMQNGGWAFSMIPAIKKLYPEKDEQIKALQRHMEFYNTHPYVSSPVLGVTLALEEDRANGAPVDDVTIQGVKVGMMGPLAGVGDPVFWFTARPILGALGASLAITGSIVGPLLFFFAWNILRWIFEWYTQEFGYKVGAEITKDLSGGLLGKITEGASILGMFVIGALVKRWVSISFKFISLAPVVDQETGKQVLDAAGKVQMHEIFNLQKTLDSLIPGLAALILTLICSWLLKKKVSPILIIVCLFITGIVAHVIGLM